jgi:hypothetical protein
VNIRHDAAQRVRHFHHVGAAGVVVVLHNGDALATDEPRVEFRRLSAFALALGIGCRHEA